MSTSVLADLGEGANAGAVGRRRKNASVKPRKNSARRSASGGHASGPLHDGSDSPCSSLALGGEAMSPVSFSPEPLRDDLVCLASPLVYWFTHTLFLLGCQWLNNSWSA
jgi:hypothetical protein